MFRIILSAKGLIVFIALIGLGLVSALARRNDLVIFAGTRNPTSSTALQELVQENAGKVHMVKLTSCVKDENEAAIADIKSIAGRLDVVIANAGMWNQFLLYSILH